MYVWKKLGFFCPAQVAKHLCRAKIKPFITVFSLYLLHFPPLAFHVSIQRGWALSQRRAPSPIEDYSMQKSFLTNGCDWNHTNSHLNNYQIIILSDSFHIRTALQSKVTKPKPLLLSHWCFSAKCNAKADFYCEFHAVMICGSNFYKIFEWLLLFLFDITTLCTVSAELYMMPLRSHRFILTSQSHCSNSL